MDSTFDCRSYKEHLASLCSLPYLVRVYPSSICCIASIIFLFQCFTNFFSYLHFLPILFHEIFFFFQFFFLIRIISFFNVLIYLYFWLCWIFVALHRLLCRCCAQASHCRVHELQWLQHMGSVVAVQGPWSMCSVLVAQWLSCSTVYGVFPDQGSNPCPLHWHVDSYPLYHQKSLKPYFL